MNNDGWNSKETPSWNEVLKGIGVNNILNVFFRVLGFALWAIFMGVVGLIPFFLIMGVILAVYFMIIKVYPLIKERNKTYEVKILGYLRRYLTMIISGLFCYIVFMKFRYPYNYKWSFYQISVVYLLIVIFIAISKKRLLDNK